jgi:tetratricopeptide (TPR) repeat protein/predicted Ser/Thr protein kinase
MTAGDQAHWRLVREIFEEAAEAESSDRAGLVALRCGADQSLRSEVEDLLALRKEPGLVLDRPPVASTRQQQLAAEAAHAAAESQQAPRYHDGAPIAGRYRIAGFLARGGMGEVYEAFDETESRSVALKFVRRLAVNQEHLETRFLREVRMARKIEHPNVCRIYDLASHEGERFCAMELLRGETLAARLARDGRISPEEALPIAGQLCYGLAAAHRAGVLHRDLKPGNVFLVDGRAVIIDFGLAAAAVRDTTIPDASLTATGAVIGTLAYMAPEQLEERGGAPADLYSLGVIFYEMLTGGKPHDARSPFRLAAQKARESHRTPSGAGIPGMPAVWREVINRSLKARPEDRYPSAEAMRQALERGRPSARFFLSQRRIFVPVLALTTALLGWAGRRWAGQDHTAPPQAAALYEQAYQAMTTAAPARAVKLLEQAVGADAKFVNAWSLLAVAHAETDQTDKAKDALLAAISARDKRWFLGRGEARALDAANSAVTCDFAGAAQRYRQLATLAGNRDFALLSRARMLSQGGRFDDAIQVLGGTLAAAPDSLSSSAARVQLAGLLARKGEQERAEAEFARAEAVYQKTGNLEGLCELWIARGANLRTQSPAQQRNDLQRAIDLSARMGNRQQNLEAKLWMVNVLERERDYNGAISQAREVAAEAQREGMLAIAARATAELGYAFVYLKQFAEALPILRQSVELAERAKSYGALASNRMKLGEVLGALGRGDEAIAAYEPAVRWYQQGGGDYLLPLILVKWGGALAGTRRFAEAEPALREACDLAGRNGEDLYQAMALQRLRSFHGGRNLRKAAEYAEQTVALGRRTLLTGAYMQAAEVWLSLGGFERAEQLIAEGEKETVEKYKEGIDRRNLLEYTRYARAKSLYLRGRCARAAAEVRTVIGYYKPQADTLARRIRACDGASPTSLRREDLAWFEGKIAEAAARAHDDLQVALLSIDAGDLALRLGDWPAARRNALRGIEASRPLRLRALELENLLVLRAAEARLGNRAAAERMTAPVLSIAWEVGFEKPSEFGGRQDLLYFWKLGGQAA